MFPLTKVGSKCDLLTIYRCSSIHNGHVSKTFSSSAKQEIHREGYFEVSLLHQLKIRNIHRCRISSVAFSLQYF